MPVGQPELPLNIPDQITKLIGREDKALIEEIAQKVVTTGKPVGQVIGEKIAEEADDNKKPTS